MSNPTVSVEPVPYRLDPDAGVEGEPAGSSSRAGLAAFLGFVRQVGLERVLRQRVHLPVQERRTGFSVVQKSLALVAALAAGCQSARDGDFVLKPDPLAAAVLGLPRWPHSSQLTRLLRVFGGQHVVALRQAVEDLLAEQSATRSRRRVASASWWMWTRPICRPTGGPIRRRRAGISRTRAPAATKPR